MEWFISCKSLVYGPSQLFVAVGFQTSLGKRGRDNDKTDADDIKADGKADSSAPRRSFGNLSRCC